MHTFFAPPSPHVPFGSITASNGSNSSNSTVRTWVTLPPRAGFQPLSHNVGTQKYTGRGAGEWGLIKRPQRPDWHYYAIGAVVWACLVALFLFIMISLSWFAWHRRFGASMRGVAGISEEAMIDGSRLYDCAYGDDYSETMKWNPAQAAWCCKHYGCACPEDVTSWDLGDEPPKRCVQQDYDCEVAPVRDWTDEKRSTCCKKYGCGCYERSAKLGSPGPQPKLAMPPCRDGLVDVELSGQWLHPAPTCEYPSGPPGIEAPPNPQTGEWVPVAYHRCQCPEGQVLDGHEKCVPLEECPEEQYCQPFG